MCFPSLTYAKREHGLYLLKVCTHYHGASSALAVDALVSQVEDERGGAVQEAKDADAHKELGRRGEVALQEARDGAAITRRQRVGVGVQPAGGDAHRKAE